MLNLTAYLGRFVQRANVRSWRLQVVRAFNELWVDQALEKTSRVANIVSLKEVG